jgi:hypothetical protein
MNTHPDPVESALRDAPYLDDGAFTAAVLEALPRRRAVPRRALLGLAALAAGLLGAVALGEPLAEAALALGASGGTALLLGGALLVLTGAALARAGR